MQVTLKFFVFWREPIEYITSALFLPGSLHPRGIIAINDTRRGGDNGNDNGNKCAGDLTKNFFISLRALLFVPGTKN